MYRIGTIELNQQLILINEADLYSLVMTSYTPKAALVQNWWARHFHL
ncbi:BRO family protein [Vibrio alginolyticus]